MLEKLFFNASVNTVGYAIIGVLNLLLTGVIIREWGLDGYGFFILIRLLTPLGYFNILDYGMFESTVRNIAKYRDSPQNLNQVFPVSLGYIGVVSILTSLLFLIFGGHLTQFVGLADSAKAHPISVLHFIALLQIPLFLMLFFEAVIKGFEKFHILRAIDIIVVASSICLIIFWPNNGLTIVQFIYYFYGVLALKLMALIAFASGRGIEMSKFNFQSSAVRRDIFSHSSTVGFGKIVSTSIEYIPIVMLAGFANIGLAGAYDVIMKIPRFIKSIMGQVNGVVVPYAASLKKNEFDKSKAELVLALTKYQSIVFAPIFTFGLVFSEQILGVWLGDNYTHLTAQMQLCFLVPIIILGIGASSSVAVSNQKILKSLNYINTVRLIIYTFLSFILFQEFTLSAFIFANIISYGLTTIFVLRLFGYHFALNPNLLVRPVVVNILFSALIFSCIKVTVVTENSLNILALVVVASSGLGISYVASYLFGLSLDEKISLRNLVLGNINGK